MERYIELIEPFDQNGNVPNSVMATSPNGDWVLYSEAQAEIARLNARVAELEATKTTLKKSVTFCGQPIMRIADVSAATAKPVPSIYRESREGTFPKPIQIGKRRQAWLKSDIDEWMQQCLQHRKGGQS